jgi:hypothetical protein
MIVYFDMNMHRHATFPLPEKSKDLTLQSGFYPLVQEKIGPESDDFVESSRYDRLLGFASVRRINKSLTESVKPESPSTIMLDDDDQPKLEYESSFSIGDEEQFDLPTGLTLIIGGSGAGKTTLLRYIAKQHANHLFIPWGEPEPEASTDAGEFFNYLNAAFTLYRDHVVLIDSFKSLSHLSGAAMQGGISMNLNLWLTAFSNMAARAGATVVATYNPQGADDKSDALFRSLSGSVTAAIRVSDVTVSRRAMFTAMSRAGDRKRREFKFDTGFATESEASFMALQAESEHTQKVAGSLVLDQPYGFENVRVMEAE